MKVLISPERRTARRNLVVHILAGAVLMFGAHAATAEQAVEPVHGIAMHGAPKYGPDFEHFDYVNPDAPKGGALFQAARGTFDSFNTLIPKGNAIGTGSTETLLTSSFDEAFTEYGLIAESLEVPEDRSWVIFNLRPEARWHDGMPITADDVVWSFETITTKGRPSLRYYYEDVISAEKLGERKVRFNFKETENRELPLIVGQLSILPKHYWENRDFEKTTLEPPLGSGPYRIKEFEPGRYVVQERVEDYWGRNLPVNKGLYNFDTIRTDFYRDDTAIRLALNSGDIDIRFENQAKAWSSDYDTPAVNNGWLIKEKIPHQMSTGMQAFVMNTRRSIFSDRTVRKALAYAFDFEWTNENLFYGQYTRTTSYFSNADLASRDLPQDEELEILKRYRDQLPAEIFTEAFSVPVTDGSGNSRQNLLTARKMLAEAGWKVNDLKLVNEQTGEVMKFEILLTSQAFERIVLPFTKNLERLGIEANIRTVDQSQYVNRIREQDFDMIVSGWGQSLSPGNEQRSYWGSYAADQYGTRNYAGIMDPVIDELIELVIEASDRESLVQRTRALDRVLLFGYYVIPNWHIRFDRVLYWDKYSRPDVPVMQGAVTSRWWFDADKQARLRQKMDTQ
ncbi:MAG: extracellular solute-binding protein [Acidiferrobacterales bacterium]|nr:extracellular solute-binding protein [Acidiferrobacterales bacterium]